jgi:t-SNARE complex subunit (syntaxin)
MVALYFSSKSDYSTLKKNMDIMSESYEEQIAALEALHLEEIKRREDALREYEREINNITEEYERALEDLKKGSEEEVENYIRDFKLQPDKLIREIENQYGFKYVE